ncbi:AVL9p protein involved in exocytic transport from the Golgi [Saccharomyces cerevisiae]|nr:AVL9p protein involved in exocytic transport from the Golgi [Saccharomyces boulardii (nom. inval.)]
MNTRKQSSSKAIVVISRQPIFGQIKDKLSIVTNAFFLQHDFGDRKIIQSLYENLKSIYTPASLVRNAENRLYIGLCLRKILHDFKRNALVLLKAIMLEKKIIVYGNDVEALCNLQFGLISLIPDLMSNLQDSGSPQLFQDISKLNVVDSFKSSNRESVLRFLGFPLPIFEKGGLFSPYTPLQQMNDIRSERTLFFMIGSSNTLLAEQKEELCHIFVNTDNSTVDILDKTLNPVLQLSSHDKKWIESISGIVSDTWNENDDETPKNSQFEGSEDFIRWQFEDYLTGLLSSVKLSDYLDLHKENDQALKTIPEDMLNSNPVHLFNLNWVQSWKETQNFLIFNSRTDDRLFDLFPPKHIYNGADTLSLLQQRFLATFHNLKRSSSNSSSNKNGHQSEEDIKDQESIESKKSVSQISVNPGKNTDKPAANLWNSWKEYFNKPKNTANEDVTESTEDLKNRMRTMKMMILMRTLRMMMMMVVMTMSDDDDSEDDDDDDDGEGNENGDDGEGDENGDDGEGDENGDKEDSQDFSNGFTDVTNINTDHDKENEQNFEGNAENFNEDETVADKDIEGGPESNKNSDSKTDIYENDRNVEDSSKTRNTVKKSNEEGGANDAAIGNCVQDEEKL